MIILLYSREVLEQNYPVKIKERRENLTQEETNLINQYNQGASPRTFGSERQRRPINVQVIMWFFLAALCTVFLLVSCILLVNPQYTFIYQYISVIY